MCENVSITSFRLKTGCGLFPTSLRRSGFGFQDVLWISAEGPCHCQRNLALTVRPSLAAPKNFLESLRKAYPKDATEIFALNGSDLINYCENHTPFEKYYCTEK